MMNVQTMRLMVDTLHAGKTPKAAQAAMKLWQGESLGYVRSSANHIFRFSRNGATYYLRLAHGTERSKGSLQAELEFVEHVASTGLAVARPVRSDNGSLIEALDEEGQRYYAVVFEALNGEQLEVDGLGEGQYRAWGNALGELHRASQTFPHQSARPSWHDEIHRVLNTLPMDETLVREVLAAGLAWMDTLPVQHYGLTHGDFEMDNLVWDGQQFQVLDFDGAVYCWYAADIAIALQDVSGAGSEERIGWFLEGYREAAPLPDDLAESIPRFLNVLVAFKVAGLLRAYATTTGKDNPEWLSHMQGYHQQWLVKKRSILKWE